MLPLSLPIGTLFTSRVYSGSVVASAHVGRLTYRWGAKGHCGIDPQPVYVIPVLGGNVCEWVTPDLIIGLGNVPHTR
jgi:hypothetical protein